MAATGVSRGWREYTGRVWHAAEELCLRILTSSAISLLFALLLHPPLNRKVLVLKNLNKAILSDKSRCSFHRT
uniref:Uncharacterized protein n=1 Tax=Zea mays TaxID=4577 RepID=A0A804LFW7_MAIZE